MFNIIRRSSQNVVADEMNRLVTQRATSGLSRRRLLSTLGTAAAVTAVSGCTGAGPLSLPAVAPSVVDVLNFALNLEYLEANFYSFVTTGAGLAAADMGTNPGAISGGAKVNFVNPIVASAAAQLALDEREHVEFLRTTIAAVGGTPVAQPALNLAAGGAVTTDATFLAASRQLEAVGISAYIGGAAFLTSSTAALTYAAQILDTEAQHEGLLRELCIVLGVNSPAVDTLDFPPTSAKIFNTNPTTGLNPVRTPSQVLQIVYGAVGRTGISSGGFFPSGLNGAIVAS
jgi:hypothetical protein